MIPGQNLIPVYFFLTLILPIIYKLLLFFKKDDGPYFSLKDSLFEFALFFISSLGDVNLFSEENLPKLLPHIKIFNTMKIELGDFIPGIFLIYFFFLEFKNLRKNKLVYFTFLVYFIYKSLYWKQKELLIIFGGESTHHLCCLIFQWIILILTVYSFKSFRKISSKTKSELLELIILKITPLILVFGYSYSCLHVLVLFLLIKNISKKKQSYLTKCIAVYLSCTIVFYFTGNRNLLSKLCVKCGIMFYDDFHKLSWLIVVIKVTYSYIMGILFFLYFELSKNSKNLKAHQCENEYFEMGKIIQCMNIFDIFTISEELSFINIFFGDKEHFFKGTIMSEFVPNKMSIYFMLTVIKTLIYLFFF